MAKRNKTVIPAEIVPRGRDQMAEDFKAMIAQVVEERVQAALAHETDSIFQPFFQSKEVCNEIRRRQAVHEQQKFANYFQDYGCLVCERRDAQHQSLGMCKT